jgi:hypothetical protein
LRALPGDELIADQRTFAAAVCWRSSAVTSMRQNAERVPVVLGKTSALSPIGNWASNAADAGMTGAVGLKPEQVRTARRNREQRRGSQWSS